MHRAVSYADTIHISGSAGSQNYNLLLELTNPDFSVYEASIHQFRKNEWEIDIEVPGGFSEARGGMRAYLWDPQSGFHTHGFTPLSFQQTYFDSLQTFPRSPTFIDSVRFYAVIDDPDSVDQVWCRLIAPVCDTLDMNVLTNKRAYMTQKSVGPFPPSTDVTFVCHVRNKKNKISESHEMTIRIQPLPDYWAGSAYLAGKDHVLLNAPVRNLGGSQLGPVSVEIFCNQQTFSYIDSVTFTKGDESLVSVPFYSSMDSCDVLVHIDPDSVSNDKNRSNNQARASLRVNRFNVTPDRGSESEQLQPDTVGLRDQILCYIPPGSVTENRVLVIDEIQPENNHIPMYHIRQDQKIYYLYLGEVSEDPVLLKQVLLTLFPRGQAMSHKPYRWDQSINQWVICPFWIENSLIKFKTNVLGFFTLMDHAETVPPTIEIQVENQPFTNGSYVPNLPLITLLIEDDSGIDIRPGRILVYIDDELQDCATMAIRDSTSDSRNIILCLTPSFEPGRHFIFATAYDIHGNYGQSERIECLVSSHREIQYLGNHPNPFSRETTFVYILTDFARRVFLKIFTVSGKLIRTFEDADMGSADYHEVYWDGRDEWGNHLANGVYFFRLIVEFDDAQREITGKIAKIW